MSVCVCVSVSVCQCVRELVQIKHIFRQYKLKISISKIIMKFNLPSDVVDGVQLVNRFSLEKLWNVEKNSENDDRKDVGPGRAGPPRQPLQRPAEADVPLHRDGHGHVDAAAERHLRKRI